MVAAAKVLWWALVGLYDETFLLLKVNVVWFLIGLLLGLPVLLMLSALLPLAEDETAAASLPLLPLLVTGLLILLVPNPASLGLYQVAAIIQRKESPPFGAFWRGTRENVRLGLAL